MRILLAGQRRGYNIESCLARALEQLGHDVFFFDVLKSLPVIRTHQALRTLAESLYSFRRSVMSSSISEMNLRLLRVVSYVAPDNVIVIKGAFILPENVTRIRSEFGAHCTLWAFDDVRLFNSVLKHVASSYDLVATTVTGNISRLNERGVRNVVHLQPACDPLVHRRLELSPEDVQKYGADLSFTGSFQRSRALLLAKLANFDLRVWGDYWFPFLVPKEIRNKLTRRSAYGEELIKVLNASKVILNVHAMNDINSGVRANMRVFEATGCGSFLLTDNAEGIKSLYENGKEVVCYNDSKELVELADYYLSSPKEREEIALRGQKKALERHTYVSRAKTLLSFARP